MSQFQNGIKRFDGVDLVPRSHPNHSIFHVVLHGLSLNP